MRIAVLLVSGKSRSGKDTFVEMLNICRMALADAPKQALSFEEGIPLDLFFTQEGKASLWKGRTIRDRLIEYAEGKRAENPSCWAEMVSNNIKKRYNDSNKTDQGTKEKQLTIIGVSDWRFLCEIDTFKKSLPDHIPIYTVRIANPNLKIDPKLDAHVSENELDSYKFNFVINNDGSLDDLKTKALDFKSLIISNSLNQLDTKNIVEKTCISF